MDLALELFLAEVKVLLPGEAALECIPFVVVWEEGGGEETLKVWPCGGRQQIGGKLDFDGSRLRVGCGKSGGRL